MTIRLDLEEWQYVGQLINSLQNGWLPNDSALLTLARWPLFEWFEKDIKKFMLPKTRKQNFRRSVLLSLYAMLEAIKPQDDYALIVHIALFAKIEQAVLAPTPGFLT